MLLKVEHLSIGFGRGGDYCEVVSDISFSLEPGSITAIVGESGCGKSLTCLALGSLLPPGASARCEKMLFTPAEGAPPVDLHKLPPRERRRYSGGGIAYVFQEPAVSLNPVFTVASQIGEALKLHTTLDREARSRRVLELLDQVGIPDPAARARAYPHELSGGMQQRVMIALALAGNPRLLIADEPTTALDVTIQAQILELLSRLAAETGMGILLITHNLGIVARIADSVCVLYAGRIVERAATRELLGHPVHPYTRKLLRSVPTLHEQKTELETIPGSVPAPGKFPPGCRFANRCGFASAECSAPPPEERVCDGHFVACFHRAEAEAAGPGDPR